MSEETPFPMELDEMVPTIQKVKLTIIMMEQRFNKLAEEIEAKDKELKEREQKLEEQIRNNQQLEIEYTSVQNELNKISSLYQEMSGKQQDIGDVKKILGIYITLLEKVFEGQVPAKMLFLLHGDKSQMTRQELTQASGFTPAAVLRSIHELRNAELVDYDEEKEVVTLKDRIYM